MRPVLRAVIDTNLIVRAVIRPTGSVAPVLFRLRNAEYLYLYSRPTLDEVAEVLNRRRIRVRYHVSDDDISTVVGLLMLRGEEVRPERHFRVCRDPDDNKFLDVAVAGAADIVATGDEDLLALGSIENIPIVQARQFIDRLDGLS